MTAGSGSSSAAGVLAQLSNASISSSDSEFDVDDTISTISTSEASSEARDGDGSNATTIDLDSTSGKAPSLLSVLKQAKILDLSRKRIIRNNLPPKGITDYWQVAKLVDTRLKLFTTIHKKYIIKISPLHDCTSYIYYRKYVNYK